MSDAEKTKNSEKMVRKYVKYSNMQFKRRADRLTYAPANLLQGRSASHSAICT